VFQRQTLESGSILIFTSIAHRKAKLICRSNEDHMDVKKKTTLFFQHIFLIEIFNIFSYYALLSVYPMKTQSRSGIRFAPIKMEIKR
jgi:hypothetical protein